MRVVSCLKHSYSLFKNVQRSGRCFSHDSKIGWILRQNETNKKYDSGSAVKTLYANQIGAHNPIQDMWAESTNIYNRDIMFGVFDGNSGIACSHVVSKRIFKYLALSLLPKEVLKEYVRCADNRFRHVEVMKSYQDRYFFLEDYRKIYEDSAYAYARDLLSSGKELDVRGALISSFERLDDDLSKEAMKDETKNRRMLWVGMTGTGATIVHISGIELTIATAGDALVVVGTESGEAKVICPEHNVENSEEVARVIREHPEEPGVLEKGLLLGKLTSFRSFGNFRYKWSREATEKVLVPRFGAEALPRNCLSPPYLTARPDITRYTLSPQDSFIVIATDGIWDIFPPKKVVEIVSRHKPVNWAKRKLLVPWKKFQALKRIIRKESDKEEMEVENSPATQLILEALVATTKKLHLPKRYIRNIRDDMTAVVLYIDKKYVASRLGIKTPEKKIIHKSFLAPKFTRTVLS